MYYAREHTNTLAVSNFLGWREKYYHQHSSQCQCLVQKETGHTIKKSNKSGPKIDPCGTPKNISFKELCVMQRDMRQ